ncbi:MAG TPA: hypothetical protein VE817_05095 [Candidatus Acidoferrum sp.]|nr:hypothetical protein [Candidatus Acidoferrum sp.]
MVTNAITSPRRPFAANPNFAGSYSPARGASEGPADEPAEADPLAIGAADVALLGSTANEPRGAPAPEGEAMDSDATAGAAPDPLGADA